MAHESLFFLYICTMKRLKELGIKNKVLLGSVAIGLMLFFAGIIAYFEFSRMSKYVSTLISDNIESVNTSRYLMNISDEYNTNILEIIGDDDLYSIPELEIDDNFIASLNSLQHHFTIDAEKTVADSVLYSYVAYMHVVNEVYSVWNEGYSSRREWYFERLQVVYDKLKGYIQELTTISQNALASNYDKLNDSFYRSIMPIIIAVSAGIVLVILFNYFLNIYILIPLLKINKGLKSYKEYNRNYDVKFDYGNDQIQELNLSIKDIVEENKSLKKK